MGRPLNTRVWAKRSLQAAYVGTFTDPAGQPACVFADARSGRAVGPLNLRLGRPTPYSRPAPRVGAPPRAEPGRLGLLELYRVEWEGARSGPDAEERGVFLRFEPGADSIDLAAGVVDPLLLGLLNLESRVAALREPRDVERAQWGLILANAREPALRQLPRVSAEAAATTRLVFEGRLPRLDLRGYEVVEPGLLRPAEHARREACVEPDAGPFAPGPDDPLRFLYAAGDAVYREALRKLDSAGKRADVLALGRDASGRLAVATPEIDFLRWCSPQAPEGVRFGDILQLTLQDERVAWAEAVGRDEAKAVDLLRRAGTPAALALRAAAGDWAGWDAPRDAKGLRDALIVHPSSEHARRLEPRLPGEGTSHEKLAAVLSAVAAYWRAGAFEDAWILLGRMPNLLPETKDAPVLRAARYLHRLLEGRHVHDASEDERNELSYVWDGTLGPVIDELGPPLSGRCAEVLENAGL